MKLKWILMIVIGILVLTGGRSPVNAQNSKRIKWPGTQTARVLITELGYSRTSIKLRRGVPVRLTFLRQTDKTCATEVVIPAYEITRSLPLNQPVVISFTPARTGVYDFTCGMKMMRGKLIVG